MATTTSHRVLVRSASYRRGYSGTDHLLDDDDFRPIVGRSFGSARLAWEAAEACIRSHGPDRYSPVSLDLLRYSDPPTRDEIADGIRRAVRDAVRDHSDYPRPDLHEGRVVAGGSALDDRGGYWVVDLWVEIPMCQRAAHTRKVTAKIRESR